METWSQTVFGKDSEGTRLLAHMLLKGTAQDLAALHEQAPSQMPSLQLTSPPSRAPYFSHICTRYQCQDAAARHRESPKVNVITSNTGSCLVMSSLLCQEEGACEKRTSCTHSVTSCPRRDTDPMKNLFRHGMTWLTSRDPLWGNQKTTSDYTHL